MQLPVTCSTLGELDEGSARLIIDAAIREAVRDVEDRGNDEKPRKVVITLTFKQMENGLVEAEVEAVARVPARRTASTIAAVKRKQGEAPSLVFQQYAADDPSQKTIDEVS